MGLLSGNTLKARVLVDQLEQFIKTTIDSVAMNQTSNEYIKHMDTKRDLEFLIQRILNHEPLTTTPVVNHREEDEL